MDLTFKISLRSRLDEETRKRAERSPQYKFDVKFVRKHTQHNKRKLTISQCSTFLLKIAVCEKSEL